MLSKSGVPRGISLQVCSWASGVVLKLAHLDQLLLQPLQPIQQRGGGVDAAAQREGVDEQAQHLLHAGEFCRAPGDYTAEEDIALPL